MDNSFLSATMLAIESWRVVELRLVRLAWGGRAGWAEAQSMVSEKIDAAIETTGMVMAGAPHGAVIARYREHVAANAKRLSA